ncbi:MAG: cytochrome c [Actinomycetota bacterium]|nr:cytochrome c [Actinomycetota bacterium]
MILATTTGTIAVFGVVLIAIGWVVYGIFNVVAGRKEVGSEIELAANRKEYHDDETLEGSHLERVQLFGVLLLVIIVVMLPAYWVFEPSRLAGAEEGWNNRFASWGSQLFAPTAEGGFNCAGCHGGMGAVGGEAPFTVTDKLTGEITAVNWKAPALNTVYYRFDESEIRFILNYGRPFSPMSPWGLVGGGPMNSQQIDNVLEYLKSIQLPRENCGVGEAEAFSFYGQELCPSGSVPEKIASNIQASIDGALASGEASSVGEAVFNLDLGSGAYSCARCHTQGWSYGNPGQTGQGAFGWNLTGGATNSHFNNEVDMVAFLKNGSEFGKVYGNQGQGSGRMPGFGAMLTDEQIEAVVAYVRSL